MGSLSAYRAARGLVAALGLGAAGIAAAGEALPDLDALVRYESRQMLPSGVTRTDVWQERLVRRDGQVWVERVLPPGRSAGHAHEGRDEHAQRIGHRHFNADTAARWLAHGAHGELVLKLVDRAQLAIVSVPRAEFGTVGFDGSFEAAASIVPRELTRRMKPAKTASSADPRWVEDHRDGWAHRVLWSERRQIAMQVESRSDDGRAARSVSVRLERGQPAPWARLGGFEQKRYDDFLD